MPDKNKLAGLRIYLFLVFLTVVTALVQGSSVTTGFPLSLRTCILIPLTVCMGMFEKELGGTLLGIFAGMLWDTFSSGADGLRSVILALTGCICGFLIHYYMRNNLLTAFVFSASASLLYSLTAWLFGTVAVSANGSVAVLLVRYIPGFLFSVAVLPLFYFIIRTAEKSFRYTYSENNTRRD